jgi:PmbA protein
MKLIAQLEEFLHKVKSSPKNEELKIEGWRVLVNEARLISLGIKENSPGSVYTPPSYREGESGEVYIIWGDGRLSQARVQASPTQGGTEYWQGQLEEWRQASYEDPEAAEIPQPEPMPLVAVEDREIQKILHGEDQQLFEQLDRLLRDKPEKAKMSAGIQAAWGYRHVRNSKGLAVTYQESQYALSFSFDSLVGGGFAKRRLVRSEEWNNIWHRTLEYYEALQKKAPQVHSETVVIFSPGVVDDFLGQYILPNFLGQSVWEGQSAFKVEQFKNHEPIFHEGLSLIVDPLRPFEWGSYLVTSEGVPAERTVLVQKGNLQSPILRMKDSKRWGAKPTGVSLGTSGLYLQSTQETPWQAMLSRIEDGILILSVLGMHTQNSVSGEYSLSAPQSLRIINGKIVGKTDVKLNGNFFKDLGASTTQFGKSEIETKPYLVVKTGVQNM